MASDPFAIEAMIGLEVFDEEMHPAACHLDDFRRKLTLIASRLSVNGDGLTGDSRRGEAVLL
nr:hypothetical protein [Tautonia marina]